MWWTASTAARRPEWTDDVADGEYRGAVAGEDR